MLQLLQPKGCADRYYAQFGARQPQNAVNLPDDIAKEDKRRRAEAEKSRKAEAEHQDKLRRMQEESHLKLTMDQSKHEAWRDHEYDRAIHKVGSSAIVHDNELQQKAQMTEQQRQALAQKNALLEQDRIVEQQFLEDIRRTVIEKNYLYEIVPGLSFVHTHSGHVNRAGFSLVQLKQPYVEEGRLHSYAVLFMATPDKYAHLPQLQYLYQLLTNADRVPPLQVQFSKT